MNLIKALFIIAIMISFTSCKENTPKKVAAEPTKNITQKVDDAVKQLELEIIAKSKIS